LFRNLFERLAPGGIVLLIHVDPRLVEYPLWDAAVERCRSWFADPDELERQLADAGFEVERDLLAYEHSVPKERYLRMVESSYMSVLTSFEEDELRAGVEEMTKPRRPRRARVHRVVRLPRGNQTGVAAPHSAPTIRRVSRDCACRSLEPILNRVARPRATLRQLPAP
jgi:hypothetical protein